jgi:hypothetical protein
MSVPEESLTERRKFLSAQIARQRAELALAYHNLEKPIHYAEYGMRGLGFFRKNAWIFVAAPTVLNIATTLFGFTRKKKNPKVAPLARQQVPIPADAEIRPRNWKDLAVTAGRNGLRLWQLYKRIRPYFL